MPLSPGRTAFLSHWLASQSPMRMARYPFDPNLYRFIYRFARVLGCGRTQTRDLAQKHGKFQSDTRMGATRSTCSPNWEPIGWYCDSPNLPQRLGSACDGAFAEKRSQCVLGRRRGSTRFL